MASALPPPAASIPTPTRILGLPVHPVQLDQVVALTRDAVEQGSRLRIAVTNANKCFLAARDPALRAFLEEAELVVPETAVVWGARVLGRTGVAPVWGVSLAARLLEEADRRGWSVWLLGAREEVCEQVARIVTTRFPGLRLVGHHHGYLDDGAVRARVVADLAKARPDLLLVAMGSPQQERFLASLPEAAAPRISLGVGGTFDVLAGLRQEAPAWVRGTGFEWLWRSFQDPRLLGRYLVVNPWFVTAVLRERLLGPPPGGTGA